MSVVPASVSEASKAELKRLAASAPDDAKIKGRPPGRPTSYSQDMADEICKRLTRGEPMARICDVKGMPSYSTVKRWEDENEAFHALSMRARAEGTHYIADDCMRIADDRDIDPQHKRIMVDTRLRLIGKWNAKAYGDKQQVEHSGGVQIVAGAHDEAL